jgi:hypothetical protein
MNRDYTGNQRGEVVTGVIVVIMCVGMMIFGGMGMMHGGHRHSDDRDKKVENKHDHQKEGIHNPQKNNDGESYSAQDEEAGSRK